MKELREAIRMNLGPASHGKTFIEVQCYCDFEGHGRASETWEEHWRLKLPQVRDFQWGRKGNSPVEFHAETFEKVKSEALLYLAAHPDSDTRGIDKEFEEQVREYEAIMERRRQG
jgi:hypothetical protein